MSVLPCASLRLAAALALVVSAACNDTILSGQRVRPLAAEPSEDEADSHDPLDNDATSDAQLGESGEEDCDPSRAERVDCTFTEDDGTICVVTFERGAPVSDVCTGSWGQSECTYSQQGSSCAYTWEGGSCSEDYSPSGTVVASTCDAGPSDGGPGDEQCSDGADGLTSCVSDDGAGTVCTTVLSGEAFVSQICSGPWGTSDCRPSAGGTLCVYGGEGGSCTEEYGPNGEVLSSTCGGDSPPEQCSDGADGLTSCVSDDGAGTVCTTLLSGEAFVSQTCSGPWGTSDCRPSAGGTLCIYAGEGGSCSEEYGPSGEVLGTTCGSSSEPDDASQCSAADDGTVTCVFDDGAGTVCTSVFQGEDFVSDTCVSPDGTSVCVPEGDAYACTYSWEGGSCSEVLSGDGAVISTTCGAEDGGTGGEDGGTGGADPPDLPGQSEHHRPPNAGGGPPEGAGSNGRGGAP